MLYLIFLVLFAGMTTLFIILFVKKVNADGDDHMVLLMLSVFSGIALFIGCMAFVFGGSSTYMGSLAKVAGVQVNMRYVESVKMKGSISQEERLAALYAIGGSNEDILENRLLRDNPWVGIFQYRPLGDMELLDPSSIPDASYSASVEVNQK